MRTGRGLEGIAIKKRLQVLIHAVWKEKAGFELPLNNL